MIWDCELESNIIYQNFYLHYAVLLIADSYNAISKFVHKSTLFEKLLFSRQFLKY